MSARAFPAFAFYAFMRTFTPYLAVSARGHTHAHDTHTHNTAHSHTLSFTLIPPQFAENEWDDVGARGKPTARLPFVAIRILHHPFEPSGCFRDAAFGDGLGRGAAAPASAQLSFRVAFLMQLHNHTHAHTHTRTDTHLVPGLLYSLSTSG